MIYFPEHLLLTESLVCLEFFMDRADFCTSCKQEKYKATEYSFKLLFALACFFTFKLDVPYILRIWTMNWNALCTLSKPWNCTCTQARDSGGYCSSDAGYFSSCLSTAFAKNLQKEKCENCRSSAELGQVSTERRAVLKVAPALCQLPRYLLCQLLLNWRRRGLRVMLLRRQGGQNNSSHSLCLCGIFNNTEI